MQDLRSKNSTVKGNRNIFFHGRQQQKRGNDQGNRRGELLLGKDSKLVAETRDRIGVTLLGQNIYDRRIPSRLATRPTLLEYLWGFAIL